MTLKWKRANKTKTTNERKKAIWLVYLTDTNATGFWLVKRTLGWRNFMPEELSRNCFDVILQHDWSIEQCLLHIRVFFGGKTKSPCFVLFIHWLIKQIQTLTETIFQGHTKTALTLHLQLVHRLAHRTLWWQRPDTSLRGLVSRNTISWLS